MLEDRRLLWRLKHGDKDALRRIYEKYEGDLVTLAAHLLHDPATAEDVVQDVFISLVCAAPTLYLRRTLQAYLATAVANRGPGLLSAEVPRAVGTDRRDRRDDRRRRWAGADRRRCGLGT